MIIIDTHVHAVSDDRARYPIHVPKVKPAGLTFSWYQEMPVTAEGLLDLMDQAGVAAANLVQPMSAYRYDNEYIADSGVRHRGRIASVCIVDMNEERPAERLRYWVEERGVSGLRLFTTLAGEDAWLDDPRTFGVWEVAAALKIPVCMQMRLSLIPKLRTVLERFSDVPVALDHLASQYLETGPALEVAEPLFPLADYPNVYLKYSAQNLKTLEPAGESEPLLRALVQRFGARRIMWGSNFPATYDRSYGELVDQGRASVAFLPEADQRWVLGETALSLWPELRPA